MKGWGPLHYALLNETCKPNTYLILINWIIRIFPQEATSYLASKYLQESDVSKRLIWCFPHKRQVSLKWFVWMGNSVTIFKTSQQFGARRNVYKCAGYLVIQYPASLKHEAHKITGTPDCNWRRGEKIVMQKHLCYCRCGTEEERVSVKYSKWSK